MATCGLHERELEHCFSEGGYYYWSFRLVQGEWKISYLFLDVNWTRGDSVNSDDYHSGRLRQGMPHSRD